ncbi:MAG: hypothetical protein ACYCVW_16645 [Rhodocyclaceae bacterium]
MTTTMTAAAKALEVKKAGLWAAFQQQLAIKKQCEAGSHYLGPERGMSGAFCGETANVFLWAYNNADNPAIGYLDRQQIYAYFQRVWAATMPSIRAAYPNMLPSINNPQDWNYWGRPYVVGSWSRLGLFLPDPSLPVYGIGDFGATPPPQTAAAQWIDAQQGVLDQSYVAAHTPPGPSFWVSLRNNFESTIVTGGEMIAAAFVIAYAAGAAYSALAAGGTTASATTAAASTAVSGGAMTPVATAAATTAGTSTGLEATAAAAMGYAKQAYGVYSAVKAIKAQHSVSQAEQVAAQQAAQQAAYQQAAQGRRAVSLTAAQQAAQKSVVSPLEPLAAIGAVLAAKFLL